MSTERRQVLNMLSEGKITVEEAEKLMEALGDQPKSTPKSAAEPCCEPKSACCKEPKFLCVKVDSKTEGKDNVNVKIPLMLVRAGIQLGGVLPEQARGKVAEALHNKGINLDLKKLDRDSINVLIEALTETSIDIEDSGETVKVYCC